MGKPTHSTIKHQRRHAKHELSTDVGERRVDGRQVGLAAAVVLPLLPPILLDVVRAAEHVKVGVTRDEDNLKWGQRQQNKCSGVGTPAFYSGS